VITALTITLQVILVMTSAFLILLILMHKGKGGGLSDMFGGGFSSNLGSSGVAEKNLNRITVVVGIVWIASVLLLAWIHKVTQ
jgi:preprotein translocase subunit SecG